MVKNKNANPAPEKKKTGFANMDAARLREIASQAGRKSQATRRGHQFTSEEAAQAARRRRPKLTG